MAEPQQYFLKWNNYLSQLTCALDNHRVHDEFVDVTLLCEGRKIKAHKVVLSACSTYFKEVFSDSPHPHPLLIFNFIKYEDLNSIIKFMYQGEVNVNQEGLNSFLQIANMLAVHGLNTESAGSDALPSNEDNDSRASTIVTSIPKSSNIRRSTSTDTSRLNKIQSLLKLAQENQAQRNLSTSVDKTITHPTPSCSQSSANKKRKLTDTSSNDNDFGLVDEGDVQAAVNVPDIASAECNTSEYILGQNNDQTAAIDPIQETNQDLTIANIKTEYEIIDDSDIEEKYVPGDDAEMTIETRRLTNPSTPHVLQPNPDLTASCSNAAATTSTATEGASSEPENSLESASSVNSTLPVEPLSDLQSEAVNLPPKHNIPSVNVIKSFSAVKMILRKFLKGTPLQNKDRVRIAKTIVDECLKDDPNITLNRDDFLSISASIVSIFPTEDVSAYYVPSVKSSTPRGKLWSAYHNKRYLLSLDGLITRRPRSFKRKSNLSPSSSLQNK